MATDSAVDIDDLQVRRAEQADLLAISRLETRVFDQPWAYSAFEGFVGEPAFLLAEVDDDLLGYVVADWMPNAGGALGHVKDLAVAPEARRNGLGRLLLRRAVSRLLVEGVATVKLEVRASNTAAKRLYADEGFEVVRRVPRYYGDGEAAFVLVYTPD